MDLGSFLPAARENHFLIVSSAYILQMNSSPQGSQEESGILNKLEVLDLRDNDLNDTIWSSFRELSSIKTLDLSSNNGLHGAHVNNLTKLSSIENLFMNDLILDDNFLSNIRIMTSIQVLSLSVCKLNRILPITGLCELKTLRELDVTRTGFGGALPWCLVNLTSLRVLDITYNYFNGNIARSPLINLTSLKYLTLSDNDFEIPISFKSFFSHSKLKFIESLNNKLLEEEDIFATSPSFQLIGLRLSNSEHGRITKSFPQFLYHQHDLIVVELIGTAFTGKFPYWLLDNNTRMEILRLSYNSFGGPLLLPLRHMRNLMVLDISNNHLEGFIPYKIANSFPSLEFLNMATNNFEGNIPSSFGDMNVLHMLDLSNNRLFGEIPGFIGNMLLTVLAMPGNHLEGSIPIEFCKLNDLWLLDLSENHLTGVIPSCFNSSDITSIRLSKNRLHGPFPIAFQNISLTELDLSYNQFSGNIQTWISSLSELTMLLLQHNDFEGNIPKELCHLSTLTLIDLSFNNFSGSIPPCIGTIDFSGINGGSSWGLELNLRSKLPLSLQNRGNRDFEGTTAVQEVEFETKGMTLPYKGNVLRLFSGINLAHNRLTGPIPPEIGNLSHIEVLNFSHNHLTGTIPETFSNLKSIESMDLSYNYLSGKIPSQLTELNFLEVFNLSNNNLSGRTPQRVAQFATFESSSYIGNPLLCGEPLPRKCNATGSPPSTPRAAINDTEGESGFMDMDVFYMSFAGSYVTVVLAIVVILLINPYWRRAWFYLVEVFITSCYYFVVDNFVWSRCGFLWK